MSLPREVVDVSITSPGIGGGSRNMPIDLNEMLVPSAGQRCKMFVWCMEMDRSQNEEVAQMNNLPHAKLVAKLAHTQDEMSTSSNIGESSGGQDRQLVRYSPGPIMQELRTLELLDEVSSLQSRVEFLEGQLRNMGLT
ncbi:hypothetical protein LINPERHAP1_LOCUS9966 [Linum perenne]